MIVCRFHRLFGAALLALTMALSSCTPWTVRPIGNANQESSASPVSADPAAYVDSIWSSKLIPAVLNQAVDARTLADALAASPQAAKQKYGRHDGPGPYHFLVKGTGKVVSVNTKSRAGSISVDLEPYDGKPDVTIQIGPVLEGTALRDATGLVHFTDFVNQLQYADVGNKLNDRVLETVLQPLSPAKLKGATVSFAGAFSMEDTDPAEISDVIPVRLDIQEGQR